MSTHGIGGGEIKIQYTTPRGKMNSRKQNDKDKRGDAKDKTKRGGYQR